MGKMNINEINRMPEMINEDRMPEMINEDRMPKMRRTYDILETLIMKGEQIEYR